MEILDTFTWLYGLEGISGMGEYLRDTDEDIPDLLKTQTSGYLTTLKAACQPLGLTMTKAKMEVIAWSIKESTYYKQRHLKQDLRELISRLNDELERTIFLWLPKSEAEKWDYPLTGWAEILTKFPCIQDDVREANRCLALGRSEASIFFAMRILEEGLYSLQKYLAVEKPKINWGEVLTRIEKKLDEMRVEVHRLDSSTTTKTAARRLETKLIFGEQNARHFHYIRGPWRDYTMHTRRERTPLDAESVLDHVRGIMLSLAGRLKQVTKR
jgi:hypothetical protein